MIFTRLIFLQMVLVVNVSKGFSFQTIFGGNRFHCEVHWHFFTASHGKGIIDGLGGTVKRSLWRYIWSGRGHSTTPQMLYEVAVQRNPNINITYVGKSQVVENDNEMKLNWSTTVPMPTGPCHLLVAEESGDSSEF